ncbi:MAG TPA: hypothetical protein PKB13_00720 [Clostridia bacterium]|nr:hypothetical protein [Clostridia bacterium]
MQEQRTLPCAYCSFCFVAIRLESGVKFKIKAIRLQQEVHTKEKGSIFKSAAKRLPLCKPAQKACQ